MASEPAQPEDREDGAPAPGSTDPTTPDGQGQIAATQAEDGQDVDGGASGGDPVHPCNHCMIGAVGVNGDIPRFHVRELVVAMAAICVLVLIWPGDIPWINDEAELIRMAWVSNERGQLNNLGLMGSVGVRYGPVPSWIYQGLLLLTSNLIAVAFLKTLASLAILIATFWRLARVLKLTRGFVLLVLASPFVYHQIRILWDNSFTTVLSPLLILAALETIRLRSLAWLAGFTVLASALFHTHLHTVLLIGPLYAVMLWAGRRDWLKRWPGVAAILALGAGSLVPYTLYAVRNIAFRDDFRGGFGENLLGWAGGARFLTGFGWAEFYLPELINPKAAIMPVEAVAVLQLVGIVTFACFAHGLYLAVRELIVYRRESRDWTPRQYMTLMALLVIAAFGAYFLYSRQVFYPHYLVGIWFCYGYFVWRSLGWFCNYHLRTGAWLITVQTLALVALLAMIKLHVHAQGGNRGMNHGATLANQIQVIDELLQYRHPESVQMAVENYRLFHGDEALIQIMTATHRPADPDSLPDARLVIRYASYDDPFDGHIMLDATPVEQ